MSFILTTDSIDYCFIALISYIIYSLFFIRFLLSPNDHSFYYHYVTYCNSVMTKSGIFIQHFKPVTTCNDHQHFLRYV